MFGIVSLFSLKLAVKVGLDSYCVAITVWSSSVLSINSSVSGKNSLSFSAPCVKLFNGVVSYFCCIYPELLFTPQ